jgi:hypothetical protein
LREVKALGGTAGFGRRPICVAKPEDTLGAEIRQHKPQGGAALAFVEKPGALSVGHNGKSVTSGQMLEGQRHFL